MTLMRLRMGVAVIILAASSAGLHTQHDPLRRAAGTAVIRGRVVAADTGLPVRDALVGVVPPRQGSGTWIVGVGVA